MLAALMQPLSAKVATLRVASPAYTASVERAQIRLKNEKEPPSRLQINQRGAGCLQQETSDVDMIPLSPSDVKDF